LIAENLEGGPISIAYDGEEEVGGTPCWVVRVSEQQRERVTRYWVEPSQGFLPLQEKMSVRGEQALVTKLLEVEPCRGGRWIPRHAIVVSRISGSPDRVRVREVRFTEISVDDPPAKEALQLKLAEGTRVHDAVHEFTWPAGKRGMPLAIDLRTYDADSLRSGLRSFQVHPERSSGLWRVVVLLNVIVLLGAGIGWFVWRRRKAAPPDPASF
jgi:hypothetical protein